MRTGIKITAPIVLENFNCGHGFFAASMNAPGVSVIIDTHNSQNQFSFSGINDDEIKSKCEKIADSVSRRIRTETRNLELSLSFKYKSHISPYSGLGYFEAIAVSTAWAINEKLKLRLQKEEILPMIWKSVKPLYEDMSFSILSTCLLGGLRMSVLFKEKYISKRLSLPGGLFFNILSFDNPEEKQSTIRKPQPWDAVNSAFFVHGLERMDFDLLQIAMSSWDNLIPEELKKRLVSEGVLSMAIIGSGPSKFVFAQNDLALKKGTDAYLKLLGMEPTIISTVIDQRGVYKQ